MTKMQPAKLRFALVFVFAASQKQKSNFNWMRATGAVFQRDNHGPYKQGPGEVPHGCVVGENDRRECPNGDGLIRLNRRTVGGHH